MDGASVNPGLFRVSLKHVSVCLLLVMLFLVQWQRLYWGNEIPVDGNTLRFYYPSWAIGKRLLSDFHSLLWDPFRGLGQPFLALPQNQLFYPFFILSPFVNFIVHVKIFIFFHIFLFAYFLARLAKLWICHCHFAVLFTLIAAVLSGFFIHRVPDLADVASLSWAPFVIYCFSKRNIWGVGGGLTMQWFAGFPPFSILTIFALFILSVQEKDRWMTILFLIKSGALFLGLSAVQWVPFLELLGQSTRPLFLGPGDYLQFSVTPNELFRSLFVPSCFHSLFPSFSQSDTAVVGFYFGPILTVFFLIGLWRGTPTVKVAGLLTLTGLFLAMGQYNGIYSIIPLIGVFRFPAQWLLLPVVFLPIVSAAGFAKLKSLSFRIFFICAISLDGLSYSTSPKSVWINPSSLQYDPLKLTGGLVPEGFRFLHSPPLINNSYQWRMTGEKDWIDFLGTKPPAMLAAEGIREAFSHTSLPLISNRLFFEKLSKSSFDSVWLDYAGVAKVLALRPGTEKDHPPRIEDVGMMSNNNPKGRAFMLNGNRCDVRLDRPGYIKVEAEGPGHLIFSESNFPGWGGKVNGETKPIVPFEGIFLSLLLDQDGPQTVEFYFRPISFLVGCGVSLLTLLFGFTSFILYMLKKSKQGFS